MQLFTDADLVERARDGDRWAEDVLVRRYVRHIGKLVYYLLGKRHDVDDVVQDTFLDAFIKLHRLKEPAAFKAWLQRIAVCRVQNYLRRHRLTRALGLDRGAELSTLEAFADEGLGPEERVELSLIDDVLRGLAPDDRIAWVLRNVEGQALEEVAFSMSCSLATVKRRIARAQRRVCEVVDLEVADHV